MAIDSKIQSLQHSPLKKCAILAGMMRVVLKLLLISSFLFGVLNVIIFLDSLSSVEEASRNQVGADGIRDATECITKSDNTFLTRFFAVVLGGPSFLLSAVLFAYLLPSDIRQMLAKPISWLNQD